MLFWFDRNAVSPVIGLENDEKDGENDDYTDDNECNHSPRTCGKPHTHTHSE